MKLDEYCLLENKQDKEAAKRWKTANQVRKSKGGVKEKILRYFRLNVGKPINGEELRYIANRSKEWARRSKELRTEEGSPIATRFPAAVLPFPLCDGNSLTLALTDQLSLEMSKRPVTLSNRFDMGESSPVKVKFSFT
jgi:hypothetical protein